MIDWTKSMQQTFEYYTVNPDTWRDDKKLTNIIKSIIDRDESSETLGSASIEAVGAIDECYVRVYLIVSQNGTTDRKPLGTFLVQTPETEFDGTKTDVTMDAYTPLLELKENPPPVGYSILKDENVMENAYRIMREHMRAPIVAAKSDDKLYNDFVANTDDTWITFLSDLIANAKKKFGLDEMGRVLFLPEQDVASLQPVWTYDDGNCSILYPSFKISRDLYGVPNIVEVVYSQNEMNYVATAINDDPNSPTSTISRGRKIIHRTTNPDMSGIPSQEQLDEYAEQLLETLSTIEYTVTYSHGYCPVRLGDCVRFNHSGAGLRGVKAKVTSQSINCTPGCKVTETAVFTEKLWRSDTTLMISGDFADAKVVSHQFKRMKKQISDIQYISMEILSFINSINIAEKGSTITDITLTWELNKIPKLVTVDDTLLSGKLTNKQSITIDNATITTDHTFTIVVTDEKGKMVHGETAILFFNGIYYGVSSNPAKLDSAFIRSLTRSLQANRTKTFTIDSGADQYVWYALPSRYGTPVFNVGGFDGGFAKVSTLDFMNLSGYTEEYTVYRSDNSNIGKKTVKVT